MTVSKSEQIEPKNVLIIAYAFPPHSVVGAMRPLRFCKYLPHISNWHPVVLSVKKHFERNDPELQKEYSSSIPVYRVPIIEPKLWYEERNSSDRKVFKKVGGENQSHSFVQTNQFSPSLWMLIKRLFAELMSTPDPQLFWIFPVMLQALKIIKKHEIKAFIITSPPWSIQIAGYFIKKMTGLPWLADLRDPWTDIPRYDRFAMTHRIDAFLEKKSLTYADKVISTSDAFSNQLRQKYPHRHSERFVTLYNGFDEEKFLSLSPRQSDAFTIVHLGTFYPLFDSFFILNAIGHWFTNDTTVDKSRVRLVFIGKIDNDIRNVLEQSGILGISIITGFKPHNEAINIAAGADALLLSIGLSPSTPRGWLPSKIFEYIALNRPIIASVLEGEAANLIRRARGGYVISGKNQSQVTDVLHMLYHQKKNSKVSKISWQNEEVVVKELMQKQLVRRLASILDDVSNTSHHHPSDER